MSGGAVVKLGGSIVTDKRSSELIVEEARVRRLAEELRGAPTPLVLVHGAGSFGHQIVRRTGLHLGLKGAEGRLAFGETQRLQYELDSAICQILLEAGIPAMPCQASASAILSDGRLESMDTAALELLVEAGMVPLLYGVPAVDRVRGCAILSGDQIAPYVASRLGVRHLIHCTDVDGVFDADPAKTHAARQIPRVDRQNWDEVRGALRGSSAIDVTGGMEGKVAALIELAQQGLSSRIIDATIEGRLAAALAGVPVGTLVTWEEA
jgi:isopentenyl phosphate kinase